MFCKRTAEPLPRPMKNFESLKIRASLCLKRHRSAAGAIIQMRTRIGEATSCVRVLPDFAIGGAQKAGTTSLYHYLKKHPCIFMPLKQEVHFFDFNYPKGLSYYRAHFPSIYFKHYALKMYGQLKVGECTPYYMPHPLVPQRMAARLPGIKLVFVLRNPVMRTYSHYQHEYQKGREWLSFENALKAEKKRLSGEAELIQRRHAYYSYRHHHFSYVNRSKYVEHVKRWLKYFPRKQMFFISSERLFSKPQEQVDRLCEFLEIRRKAIGGAKAHNTRNYPPMNVKTREMLEEYFKPYNQALYDLIEMDFGW